MTYSKDRSWKITNSWSTSINLRTKSSRDIVACSSRRMNRPFLGRLPPHTKLFNNTMADFRKHQISWSKLIRPSSLRTTNPHSSSISVAARSFRIHPITIRVWRLQIMRSRQEPETRRTRPLDINNNWCLKDRAPSHPAKALSSPSRRVQLASTSSTKAVATTISLKSTWPSLRRSHSRRLIAPCIIKGWMKTITMWTKTTASPKLILQSTPAAALRPNPSARSTRALLLRPSNLTEPICSHFHWIWRVVSKISMQRLTRDRRNR